MEKYTRAVTFSFDDGNIFDLELVELFNRYGLKCSFNLNSGLYGTGDVWDYHGIQVSKPEVLKPEYYTGHEICIHGLKHLAPTELNREQLLKEFGEDKKNLEGIFGQKIEGAAYAYGCYNELSFAVLRELGILHCRTVESTWDFGPQENMLAYKPAGHFNDANMFDKIDAFFRDETPENRILYIWGHSYECAGDGLWGRMEDIMKAVSGREGVLYAPNTECFRRLGFIR